MRAKVKKKQEAPRQKRQHSLRFEGPDLALLAALDSYATRQRQARNAAILSILEKVLREESLYPPG